MADPTNEIERIRTLLATNDGAVPFDVARTLLAALDAERAESARLRRRLETMPPWPRDGEPLSDEQMRALKLRWSTGPERYQADADALIATVLHERAEAERLRHALQVAHDWMGRAPDNDCDEGGGWGHAHLRTAEETVIAALTDSPAVRPATTRTSEDA